jgi:hypothetical protein
MVLVLLTFTLTEMYVKFHTLPESCMIFVTEYWYVWHFCMNMDPKEIGWEGVDCIQLA